MFWLEVLRRIWSGTLWLEPSEGVPANVAEGDRRQQFKFMEESDIKEYLGLVKDADEVVVASEVELIDFTEQYERDGKKVRYFEPRSPGRNGVWITEYRW